MLSTFYRILTVLGIHFGSLGPTFWGLFFRSQKMPEVLLHCAPGGRPSSTPPGEGGNWEASRRHLGGKGPEEAQRRLGLKKLIDVCSQMQKFLLCFQFYEAFLKVGITNYQFLQRIMMAGSAEESAKDSWALYQHRQDPSEASSVWGMLMKISCCQKSVRIHVSIYFCTLECHAI